MKRILSVFVPAALLALAMALSLCACSKPSSPAPQPSSASSAPSGAGLAAADAAFASQPDAGPHPEKDEIGVRGEEVDWIFNGTDPIIEPQGSIFILRSKTYSQAGLQREEGEPYSEGFDGTMQVTVNRCLVYDSLEDAGFSWQEIRHSREGIENVIADPCFMLLDLTIDRGDAVFAGEDPNEFTSSWFTLAVQDDFAAQNWNNPNYFSEIYNGMYEIYASCQEPHGEGTHYSYFQLAPGQTAQLQLGFFVDRALLEQPLYLHIGLNNEFHFGIRLDPVPAG